MPVLFAVQGTALFGILVLPVLINRRRYPRQPVPVFDVFQQIRRGKKLDGVRRRVGQRFQRPGRDQTVGTTSLLSGASHPVSFLPATTEAVSS